jgi:hypothetical protein
MNRSSKETGLRALQRLEVSTSRKLKEMHPGLRKNKEENLNSVHAVWEKRCSNWDSSVWTYGSPVSMISSYLNSDTSVVAFRMYKFHVSNSFYFEGGTAAISPSLASQSQRVPY